MVAAVVVTWWAPAPALAQVDGPPRATLGSLRPAVKPVRVQAPPLIDGHLSDPVWQTAARVTRFVQTQPLDGDPASERTEVSIAYDKDNLYFGIYAHYSDQSLVRANRVDRDLIWNDDRVSVIFDPFLDQQRAYRFTVNGYGVQGDALVTNSGGTGDTSWNVLFASAGALVEDGWTAEIAIPFKSLRYPARRVGETHQWGLQLERDIVGKNENVVWSPVSRDVVSVLAQMGRVEGLSDLSTSHNFEFLPTATAFQTGRLNPAGEFKTDTVTEGGANIKYGITSNLTLDFTYNPDFSQIESDRQQIEVNQRFPVQYPELRPFFLEGQEIFRIPGPVTFIHTRTIIDPQFGVKVSGKVGRTTMGLLIANDEAPGKISDARDPAFGKTSQFVVGRAKYDLYRESTASVIFTNREFLDQHSLALGGDGDFALGRTHRFFGRVIFTDHRDALGVRRKGYFYDFNLNKTGRSVGYSLISNAISPDLRTDAGFVRRVDQRQTLGSISYRWWPTNWIVNWQPRYQHSRNYQFNGTLQETVNALTANFTFARNITANASLNRDMERYRDVDYWKTRFGFGGRIATSRSLQFSGNYSRGDQIRFITNAFLGLGTTWDIAVTAKPLSRLQSDLTLATSTFTDTRTNHEEFDVKILRIQTTYQFTPRLLVRDIVDHNTLEKTFGSNVLLTYRVNSGTVFFLGYDDRFRHGDQINSKLFPATDYQRTNRAIFTKFQYLLRFNS